MEAIRQGCLFIRDFNQPSPVNSDVKYEMNPPPIPEVPPSSRNARLPVRLHSWHCPHAPILHSETTTDRAEKLSVRANTGLICSFATWHGRRHIASYGWTGISYLAHSEWQKGRKEAVSPGWHLFALSAVKKLFVGNELIHRSSRSLIAANLGIVIWKSA